MVVKCLFDNIVKCFQPEGASEALAAAQGAPIPLFPSKKWPCSPNRNLDFLC